MSDDSHPVLTTVGLAAVALGVLMVVQPSVAAGIGVGYAAALVVGLLALVQGVRVAIARRASEIRGAETPDVEAVEAMPTPGHEFDHAVARLGSGPRRVVIRERTDLRERLEDAAITAVADSENCSREEAVERIESGRWTDDPHAASLLGGDDVASPPLFDWVKVATSGESTFQYRARRTADAVARVAGVTPDESEGEGDGESGAEPSVEPDEDGDDLDSQTATDTDDRESAADRGRADERRAEA